MQLRRYVVHVMQLSFLGLGGPNVATWGSMIGIGRENLRAAGYLVAEPGLAIILMVLALNLVSEGLNDELPPGWDRADVAPLLDVRGLTTTSGAAGAVRVMDGVDLRVDAGETLPIVDLDDTASISKRVRGGMDLPEGIRGNFANVWLSA